MEVAAVTVRITTRISTIALPSQSHKKLKDACAVRTRGGYALSHSREKDP